MDSGSSFTWDLYDIVTQMEVEETKFYASLILF